MKWIFYVIVILYMFYRTVYGIKPIYKETRSLSIEPINYGENKNFIDTGKRISVVCKGASINQKVTWVDPEGNVVQRDAKSRVYVQEHFVPSHRPRVPALLLVINRAIVEDTGLWECRSGDVTKDISICVIDPASFVDTSTEVTADYGRSITLSCQAKGEPEPRLLWYRNGEVITDEFNHSKYQLMTKYNSQGFEGLLTITSLNSGDSGEYFCAAIQESPIIDNCNASEIMNITLYVNYKPMFVDANETAVVLGEEDKSVDLVCAASGHPTPTYRWFKEIGDILSEYPKDVIQLTDDGEKATLTLIANSSSFGQRYRCRATNKYGDIDKAFILLKLEKPRKPDELELENANDNNLVFYVKWYGVVLFHVNDIKVQYLKKNSLKRKPIENDWKKATEVDITIEDNDLVSEEKPGVIVILPELEEETEYWVRVRAVNDAGISPWSKVILASTIEKVESEDSTPSTESTDDTDDTPIPAAQLSDSTFYGVFFAGGIVVVAVGCMFAMRMV